jgi:hypothetical protein
MGRSKLNDGCDGVRGGWRVYWAARSLYTYNKNNSAFWSIREGSGFFTLLNKSKRGDKTQHESLGGEEGTKGSVVWAGMSGSLPIVASRQGPSLHLPSPPIQTRRPCLPLPHGDPSIPRYNALTLQGERFTPCFPSASRLLPAPTFTLLQRHVLQNSPRLSIPPHHRHMT